MGKILIIFMGLILGCNLSFAKSLSCWEEYTRDFTPNTKSKMQSVLGSDVTITRIKSGIKAVQFAYSDATYGFSEATYPLYDYLTYKESSTNYYSFFGEMRPYRSENGVQQLAGTFSKQDETSANGDFYYIGDDNDYDGRFYLDYSSSGFALYVHTYCIVDEGSSSGSGGATGSVNFIIKATS